MTPEKTAQLKRHLQAISQLLYDECDPADMQTLEEIELTVREKIQTHGHLEKSPGVISM